MKNYQTYVGPLFDGLQKFLREGLTIASTAEIMKRRINNENFFNEGAFDTSDLALYSKANKKKIKFALTVNNQNQITENGREILEFIQEGYVIKDDYDGYFYPDYINLMGQYEEVKGVEVSRTDFPEKITHQTESEILNNKALRILARHPDEVPKEFAEDKNLLKEYAKWVQLRTNNDKYMAMALGNNFSERYEKLRIVKIDTAYSTNTFSKGLIDADKDLDHPFHFVGYLEKERSKNSLQSILLKV